MVRIVNKKERKYYYTIKVNFLNKPVYISRAIEQALKYVKGATGIRSILPVSTIYKDNGFSIIIETKKPFMFEKIDIINLDTKDIPKYDLLNEADILIRDNVFIKLSYDIVKIKFRFGPIEKKDWMTSQDYVKFMEFYIHVRNELNAYEDTNGTFVYWTFFTSKKDLRRNKLVETFLNCYGCRLKEGDDITIITEGS